MDERPLPVPDPRRATPWQVEVVAGHPLWRAAEGDLRLAFVGRAPLPAGAEADVRREPSLADLLRTVAPDAPPLAWARQIHSAEVLAVGGPGEAGRGDALVGEGGHTLAIVTADCVPVVIARGDRVAAVHAGWRGIAAGVVGAALRALAADGDGQAARAWIGPAIGPCCYEVSDEVAAEVVAASTPAVAAAGPRGRPHLDLQAAVAAQLAAGGAEVAGVAAECTRCSPELLWSYRRDQPCGRNVALVWRAAASVR